MLPRCIHCKEPEHRYIIRGIKACLTFDMFQCISIDIYNEGNVCGNLKDIALVFIKWSKNDQKEFPGFKKWNENGRQFSFSNEGYTAHNYLCGFRFGGVSSLRNVNLSYLWSPQIRLQFLDQKREGGMYWHVQEMFQTGEKVMKMVMLYVIKMTHTLNAL